LPREHIARIWLAIASVSTILMLTAYTLVQQLGRLSADDLPLYLAQTAVAQLDNGAAPNDVVPTTASDVKSDTIPFVIVTDSSENILASSAKLNGAKPLPPIGTFQYTTVHGTDHFTWQPTTSARLATRILPYKTSTTSGFVVAGHSLKQVEDRQANFNLITLAAWAVSLIVVFLALWFPL